MFSGLKGEGDVSCRAPCGWGGLCFQGSLPAPSDFVLNKDVGARMSTLALLIMPKAETNVMQAVGGQIHDNTVRLRNTISS